MLMMTPDLHLNKNSKAMAQLAPLDKNPAMNLDPPNLQDRNGGGGGQRQVNLPTMEQL